ncbi:SOS response-associated peptidase [Candidatus Woesearchaeota archaeon]|nr:SOS response-associated peptidase [Candidatus Woesearchaeota archaeon]
MCGRFSLVAVSQALAERFNAVLPRPIKPRYNIAPSSEVPVIMNRSEEKFTIARWGLIPPWAQNMTVGYKMINARVETLQEKPSYKMPFKLKRCLVPADGFYEWKKTPEGRIPYRITLKSEELFAFAGLYDRWRDPEGNEVMSFTIITLPPNDLVRQIHDRMPAILRKEHEKVWLADTPARTLLDEILQPYPAELMQSFRISSMINSPSNDGPELIRPVKSGQTLLRY